MNQRTHPPQKTPAGTGTGIGKEDPGESLSDPAVRGAQHGESSEFDKRSTKRAQQQEKAALDNVRDGYDNPNASR